MKYIGPFLRINKLNKVNIKNQLFHLSKEAIKNIVLESHCGISTTAEELSRASHNIDINTITKFSPLLCIYKKASAKLLTKDNYLYWNENRFKKQIDIFGNVFMTLSLLELADYYKKFKSLDTDKYVYSDIYLSLSRMQLEFFASNLRNDEGVFVDKIDTTDPLMDDITLEEKTKKFRFSNQALLMTAYYKYSTYDDHKYADEFKRFSLDILDMLLQFKDELYSISISELLKICISLNIFYKYSKNEDAKNLIIDLSDMLTDNYKSLSSANKTTEIDSLLFINYILLYKNTHFLKFKDKAKKTYDKLIKLYNNNFRIFIKSLEEKNIEYSSNEIIQYLFCLLIYSDIYEDSKNDNKILDIFKHQIVNSGLILSWPDSPPLDDIERYKDFTLHSDDLLDEQNFRMPTIPTPESNELAPVFIKHITFNKKKEVFKQSNLTFDSNKNMMFYFMIIYYHNHM